MYISPGMSSIFYMVSQPVSWLEALALNKCLLGEMKYIYKTKSLINRYTITW